MDAGYIYIRRSSSLCTIWAFSICQLNLLITLNGNLSPVENNRAVCRLPRRDQLQFKIDRAHTVRIKAESFIDAAEALNSQEAAQLTRN